MTNTNTYTKFRVYLNDYKVMIYPHIDRFVPNSNGVIHGKIYPEFIESGLQFKMFTSSGKTITPKQIIMISTSLIDINGKEIYEGDKVLCYKWFDGLEDKPKNREIVEVKCSIQSSITNTYSSGSDGCMIYKKLEVVGNIYENSSST